MIALSIAMTWLTLTAAGFAALKASSEEKHGS